MNSKYLYLKNLIYEWRNGFPNDDIFSDSKYTNKTNSFYHINTYIVHANFKYFIKEKGQHKTNTTKKSTDKFAHKDMEKKYIFYRIFSRSYMISYTPNIYSVVCKTTEYFSLFRIFHIFFSCALFKVKAQRFVNMKDRSFTHRSLLYRRNGGRVAITLA